MKRWTFFFILLPLWLFASSIWDEEDLSIVHHVNVISGDLNLSFHDTEVQGAATLPLTRTYTSDGAYDHDGYDKTDLLLKKLAGGWLIQGGWNFFPHANLLLKQSKKKEYFRACLAEPSGSVVHYRYSHKVGKHYICLAPVPQKASCPNVLSGKTNSQNNRIILDRRHGIATLELPNGGKREYQGATIRDEKSNVKATQGFYKISMEYLPNHHFIRYHYDEEARFVGLTLKTPRHKELASISFNLIDLKRPYHFEVDTSDGKTFAYSAETYQKREYLNRVTSNCRLVENLSYEPAGKKLGARVNSLAMGGNLRFKVEYDGGRVKKILSPVGPNGEELAVATFIYFEGFTDVRDVHGLLTRYHHEDEQLLRVEYFDSNEQCCRSIQLSWREEGLAGKTLLNASGEPVFSKSFRYDAFGNVCWESFWGNLTGRLPTSYILQNDGSLKNSESTERRYFYSKGFNLLTKETNEDGLTTRYEYRPGTDLLTAKFICSEEAILSRQFFIYDKDHLLVEEISDNGCSEELGDLSGAFQRTIKRHTRDEANGMVEATAESFWDPHTGQEKLLKKTRLSYSTQKLPIREEVYDAEGRFAYSLETTYDAHGRTLTQEAPLGGGNRYEYDHDGNLIYVKEVGEAEKRHTYDRAGRLIFTLEEGGKETHFSYDAKGQLLSKTEGIGSTTYQEYDEFGRCVKTTFPQTLDETGALYSPETYFTYDEMGNLATSIVLRGGGNYTQYTARRRPFRVVDAEGNETHHTYNLNGTLERTIFSDGTYILYEYDLFQRVTAKRTFSEQAQLLSEEHWEYDAFNLLAHTDERGLTTYYTYDGAGRKISENAEGREKRFSYDALGFLERVEESEIAHVQIHDVAGNVVDEWEEDSCGRIENRTESCYDAEGRKVLARRHTSQGVATDTFAYDVKGRLIEHTDPLGATTHIYYDESFINGSGQQVLQKTIVDALGHSLVETYDLLTHLVSMEKRDADHRTLSRESYYYDRAGNKASRETTIYQDAQPVKTHTCLWKYDACGRLLKEIEAGQKTTDFSYHPRGWLAQKTQPNGVSLKFEYDGLGRLVGQESSDRTVQTRFIYDLGPEPVELHDLVKNTLLKRSYDPFGTLIQEINACGHLSEWQYDQLGRCTVHILPDGSLIQKSYEGLHLAAVSRNGYSHSYSQFDRNGHVQQETFIEGSVQTTARDLLERPWTQTTPWHHLENSYGPTSLILSCKDSLGVDKDYTYDPLDQIRSENQDIYSFDSIGNATDSTVSDCNEILESKGTSFLYDLNGNPTSRLNEEGVTFYTYDALNRLTSIQTPDQQVTHFTYDPLSRLMAQDDQIYLYDQEHEIGRLDREGNINQLKVLGLGIKGDIGAAVAIELEGLLYAPLHDLRGNIIALVSPGGALAESYHYDAFGREKDETLTQNPWRYSSKRNIQGLVYFGLRFYDPTLGRWLTPDPAGPIDSPNLYLYVLNSPLNRLDLFGLYAQSIIFDFEPHNPYVFNKSPTSNLGDTISAAAIIDGVRVDCVFDARILQKLKFTRDEQMTGKVDLSDHPYLFPKENRTIGLVSLQNGINTNLGEFEGHCRSVIQKIPEETLFLGIHRPTRGIVPDLINTGREIMNVETNGVVMQRQMLVAIADSIHKINPEMLWHFIMHSEQGATCGFF
ncbi:MAG: tRNA(Glu)-specific nuclease WapA, partial [Chlamydiae bacterium]|nr:tRNA(Glu)-specific nuclease WapA [Chlamydiota bacterium]